jgi:hypothetical protein
MRLTITFAGAIADQQRFLDGARVYTVEAEDQPATGWRLSLALRRPMVTERVEEGDLTLVEPGGGELSATLVEGTAAEIADEDGVVNAARIDLRFEVSGGEGGFAGAAGSVRVHGTISGEGEGAGVTYEGEGALLTADLEVEGASGVWT